MYNVHINKHAYTKLNTTQTSNTLRTVAGGTTLILIQGTTDQMPAESALC